MALDWKSAGSSLDTGHLSDHSLKGLWCSCFERPASLEECGTKAQALQVICVLRARLMESGERAGFKSRMW